MSAAIKNLFEKVNESVKEGALDPIQKERLYLLIGRRLESKADEFSEDELLSEVVSDAYETLLKKEEPPPAAEEPAEEYNYDTQENEEDDIISQTQSVKEKPLKDKKYSVLQVKKNKETGMVSINGHEFLFMSPAFEAIMQKYMISSSDAPKIRQKAAGICMNMLSTVFDKDKDNEEELVYKTAFQLFRTLGMGIFFKSHDDSSNLFHLKRSYLAEETLSIFGKQKEPVCYFAAGYLMGVYAFIKKMNTNEILERISITEKNCHGTGDEYCFFEIIENK